MPHWSPYCGDTGVWYLEGRDGLPLSVASASPVHHMASFRSASTGGHWSCETLLRISEMAGLLFNAKCFVSLLPFALFNLSNPCSRAFSPLHSFRVKTVLFLKWLSRYFISLFISTFAQPFNFLGIVEGRKYLVISL